MSATYHTPIGVGATLDAATLNSPLGELDAALLTIAYGTFDYADVTQPATPDAGFVCWYFSDGEFYIVDDTGTTAELRVAQDYILLQEQQASGVDGGNFTSGDWRTRTLNTEVTDTAGICTLAANQFTLAAGTYQFYATVPAFRVDDHQAILYNVTDAETTIIGTSEHNGSSDAAAIQTASVIAGEFTITETTTFEIQHQCQTTRNADGFGVGAGFTTEIYTQVEIWR